MLIANATGLKRLKFVTYDPYQINHAVQNPNSHPLQMFSDSISPFTIRGVWPPGYESLRSISVCSNTST